MMTSTAAARRPLPARPVSAAASLAGVCFLFLAAGCTSTAPTTAAPVPTPDEPDLRMDQTTSPWIVSYGDGSGNEFLFEQGHKNPRFSYSPVTPAQSSSGTYSGGQPRSGDIDTDGVRKLWALVDRCAAATDQHAPTRAKGTGIVTVETDGPRREFILARGPCLTDFEAFLADYRGPSDAASTKFQGVAQNAKSGALLVTADGEVWVDLQEWPDELLGKTLIVTGRFETRGDLPVFVDIPGEPAKAGIPVPEGTDLAAAAKRDVLRDIRWQIVE